MIWYLYFCWLGCFGYMILMAAEKWSIIEPPVVPFEGLSYKDIQHNENLNQSVEYHEVQRSDEYWREIEKRLYPGRKSHEKD